MRAITFSLLVSLVFISCNHHDKAKTSSAGRSDTIARDNSLFDAGEFTAKTDSAHFPVKVPGWVDDFEKVFDKTEVDSLNATIAGFEKETSNEIVIVTIKQDWVNPGQFDDYVLKLAREWGVGKAGVNNGVVIGFSRGLRKIRICNGFGIEEKLSDADTKKILDEIILPSFKQGGYYRGVSKGLAAIMNKIR